MKALFVVETDHVLSMADRELFLLRWRAWADDGFRAPLVLSDNARASILYVPDDFTEAKMLTPEEALGIIKMITGAQIVMESHGSA